MISQKQAHQKEMSISERRAIAAMVCYYLSKYDRKAYESLGYSTMSQGHKEIGRLLGLKPNYIKNVRDEFDPWHSNSRKGWYQRPNGLRPNLEEVSLQLRDMSQGELYEYVLECLKGAESELYSEIGEIALTVSKKESNARAKVKSVFNPQRAETGRIAEEYFVRHFERTGKPVLCTLHDTRERGCGYDFEIQHGQEKVMVEVKGPDGERGGVSFTSKEWDVAREKGDSYFLAIVKNISDKSGTTIQLIRNPVSIFSPKKIITTVRRINWGLSDTEIRNVEKMRE